MDYRVIMGSGRPEGPTAVLQVKSILQLILACVGAVLRIPHKCSVDEMMLHPQYNDL